jgi:hypothetical protein
MHMFFHLVFIKKGVWNLVEMDPTFHAEITLFTRTA